MEVIRQAGSEAFALYAVVIVNPGLHLRDEGGARETSWLEANNAQTSDVPLSVFLFSSSSPSLFDPFQKSFSNHIPSALPLLLNPITFFLVGSLDDFQLSSLVHGNLCEQCGPLDRKWV